MFTEIAACWIAARRTAACHLVSLWLVLAFLITKMMIYGTHFEVL